MKTVAADALDSYGRILWVNSFFHFSYFEFCLFMIRIISNWRVISNIEVPMTNCLICDSQTFTLQTLIIRALHVSTRSVMNFGRKVFVLESGFERTLIASWMRSYLGSSFHGSEKFGIGFCRTKPFRQEFNRINIIM